MTHFVILVLLGVALATVGVAKQTDHCESMYGNTSAAVRKLADEMCESSVSLFVKIILTHTHTQTNTMA